MAEQVRVGLIGAGTVGGGVLAILVKNADVIERRLGCPLVLSHVAERSAERRAALNLPEGVVVRDDAFAVAADPQVDVVVELIGGTGIAREVTLAAFAAGKPVVTANKALIAAHGEELLHAAAKAGVQYAFEAAVGGGIPILRALREGFTGDRIQQVHGIINGTANFILTRMRKEGMGFETALKEAQRKGYAEADPTYDVEGIDTAHKLAILVAMAFGGQVRLEDIYTEGITRITSTDIGYAKAFGCKIKLLAIAKAVDGEIEARVHPTMVPETDLIAQVDGAFNAVAVTGDFVGPTLFYGKGAGANATGSAVVGDLVDVARSLRAGTASRVPPMAFQPAFRGPLVIRPMARVRSLYYLHFRVVDQPGVLSDLAGALGRHGISIARVIQDGRAKGQTVSLVVMTHRAEESSVQAALAEIGGLSCMRAPATLIRVESDAD